jgi:hypothetical protein
MEILIQRWLIPSGLLTVFTVFVVMVLFKTFRKKGTQTSN